MAHTNSLRGAALACAALTFATPFASARAGGPEAWGPLQPGPYQIGFRVQETHDHSRPFAPGVSRPLQISIWYPAGPEAASRRRLTLGDIAGLIATETRFSPADPRSAETRRTTEETLLRLLSPDFLPTLDGAALGRILAVPVGAVADAPPAAGRFPLLLWGKGEDGHALDHALLNEYLASHGYVVASTPAQPQHARRVQRHDAVSVRTQLQDLAFVIQALHPLAEVDPERLGVLAWSFGGLPAALLAMRNPHVRAVVSLDSRIGYRNSPEVFSAVAGYDPTRLTVPLLHLTGSGEPRVERLKDPSFLDGLRYADVYRVTLADLRHRDFNLIWGALPDLSGVEGPWPQPPAEIAVGIGEIVRTFLDAILNQRPEAREALAQLVAGDHLPGISAASLRAGRPSPPSPDDFLWTLTNEGIAEAAPIFREARRENPTLQLFAANDLLRHCRDLLRSGELADAEAVAQLVLEAYPTSSMSHYLLAQIATIGGRAEVARDRYSRCLEALPMDDSLQEAQREQIRRDVESRLTKSGSKG